MMLRDAIKAIPGTVWLKRKLLGQGIRGTGAVPLTRAADREPPPAKKTVPAPDDFPERPTFALYRIIGNDLVPRHRKGQARANLPFILNHEPDWPDCEKWFVVNRIVDREEEAAIINLLEQANKPYLHIPFDLNEFRAIGWELDGVPAKYLPTTPLFKRLRPEQQARIIARINRAKINYFTNNNGSRNAALHHGRQRADWVLPWDGNCFITDNAWQSIRASLLAEPDVPYWLVPMARTIDNQALLDPDHTPTAEDEPQVIFRRDASLSFDENFVYGRRPKVELFWRLGVPGPWDEWGIEPWDLPCPAYATDAGAWSNTGWVARLSSGRNDLEQKKPKLHGLATDSSRALVRAEASTGLLDQLERQILSEALSPGRTLLTIPTAAQRPILHRLLTIAKSARAQNGSAEICLRSEMQAAFAWTLAAQLAKEQDPISRCDSLDWQAQATSALNTVTTTLPAPAAPKSSWLARRHSAVYFPETVFALDATLMLAQSNLDVAMEQLRLKDWSRLRLQTLLGTYPIDQSEAIAAYWMEKITIQWHLADCLGLRNSLRDGQAWLIAQGSALDTLPLGQAAARLMHRINLKVFADKAWQCQGTWPDAPDQDAINDPTTEYDVTDRTNAIFKLSGSSPPDVVQQ